MLEDCKASVQARQKFGYNAREAVLFVLVALHGIYFLRRQCNRFIKRKDVGSLAELIETALTCRHRGSLSARITSTCIISSHALLSGCPPAGQPQPKAALAAGGQMRLTALDFALEHPRARYLATEAEEISFVCNELGDDHLLSRREVSHLLRGSILSSINSNSVSRLGVDRGITSFQRYAFLMRSGKAYFATPLDRIAVRTNPSAQLLDELDTNGWLSRFRRVGRRQTLRWAFSHWWPD